jgi:hypothetical protein
VIPDLVQVEPGVRVTGLQPDDYEVQARLAQFAAGAGIAVIDPRAHARARRARGQRTCPGRMTASPRPQRAS